MYGCSEHTDILAHLTISDQDSNVNMNLGSYTISNDNIGFICLQAVHRLVGETEFVVV